MLEDDVIAVSRGETGVDDRLLTVEEVAERLKVHPESVRRWLRDGTLAGHLVTRRAGWRIPESAFLRFARGEPLEGKGSDSDEPAD